MNTFCIVIMCGGLGRFGMYCSMVSIPVSCYMRRVTTSSWEVIEGERGERAPMFVYSWAWCLRSALKETFTGCGEELLTHMWPEPRAIRLSFTEDQNILKAHSPTWDFLTLSASFQPWAEKACAWVMVWGRASYSPAPPEPRDVLIFSLICYTVA